MAIDVPDGHRYDLRLRREESSLSVIASTNTLVLPPEYSQAAADAVLIGRRPVLADFKMHNSRISATETLSRFSMYALMRSCQGSLS
jgi:hypothetical protein